MTFDAIVVGGSFAGMAAALQLARARRAILVIDSGVRRNRFASHSHGFLGQDGRPPGEIIAEARSQLGAYPNVQWVEGAAARAGTHESGFEVVTDDGRAFSTRRLVLASGVADQLPDVPGLSDRWGRSVFHCPYCHGYELGGGPLGVLASGEMSLHHALMLPDWGPTTLFLNQAFEPTGEQLDRLGARGVTVERAPVTALEGEADVRLADGRVVALAGLFTLTRTHMASPLAGQLGCEVEAGPTGEFVRTDGFKETSVQGVFSCGDMARAMGSVTLAVGDGAMAGVATHQSLIFR